MPDATAGSAQQPKQCQPFPSSKFIRHELLTIRVDITIAGNPTPTHRVLALVPQVLINFSLSPRPRLQTASVSLCDGFHG